MTASVLTSLRPLMCVAKLAGLALFSIDAKSWRAKLSRLDRASIPVAAFVHLFLNFIYWRAVFGPDIDGITNEILEVSTPLLIYIDYLINAFATVWIFAKRRRLVELLLKFGAIDESLAMEFGAKFDYVRQRRQISAALLAMVVVATLINTNDFVTSAGIKINSLEFYNFDIIFFFWNSLCQLVQFCCFVVCMRAIRQRFEALGRCISRRPNAVRILTRIHLDIARLIDDFNDIFSPVMFVHFADIFCWLCFLIFDIAIYPSEHSLEALAMNIPHSVYMTSFLIVTIATAESVKREARRCILRLHEIGAELGGGDDKSEVLHFVLQLATMPAKFSCGLVDFDWKMLFKFISAGVMYLIILVQLDNSLLDEDAPPPGNHLETLPSR